MTSKLNMARAVAKNQYSELIADHWVLAKKASIGTGVDWENHGFGVEQRKNL